MLGLQVCVMPSGFEFWGQKSCCIDFETQGLSDFLLQVFLVARTTGLCYLLVLLFLISLTYSFSNLLLPKYLRCFREENTDWLSENFHLTFKKI